LNPLAQRVLSTSNPPANTSPLAHGWRLCCTINQPRLSPHLPAARLHLPALLRELTALPRCLLFLTLAVAISSEWMSLPPTNTMKSSGVSRYFSRRDKHHEKRSAKTSTSKVRMQSLASFSSLTPLLCIGDRALLQGETTFHRRRHSSSLEALYHKLPSAFRASVEDSLLFFQKNPPSPASLNSTSIQSSTNHSSDHQSQQSRPSHHVSPDLYTIFTNEDAQTAADIDTEKKVGHLWHV
jgi:hypothetical protein